ncbi:uncharacterized protein TNCV_360781 [Trichonephila clavipes]|nr:uncharacterized protein TNCV_360781 [Trichonephila clavipes]
MEPSIKQIKYGFFPQCFDNQGEYSFVIQSFLDSDMFKSSTSFYRHLGRWSNTLVSCPECQEPMTVRHFYSKHAAPKYNLDCRKQCLFCFGRKHWPYGQKNRPENVNHVTACLQRFVEDAKIHEETEEEEVVCACRHF